MELAIIRGLVFLCFIFVPAILISNKEKAKARKRELEEQGKEEYNSDEGTVTNKTLDEQDRIDTYLDEVREAYLIFKKNEASLEIVIQASIQILMLLLSRTQYPVASGLQSIFGQEYSNFNASNTLGSTLGEVPLQLSSYTQNHLGVSLGDVLLTISVCWSFKTGIRSFLKIHSEQKGGMLSGAAKLVLGLRGLFFSVTRIVCIVAFFGPFLGILDTMAHWHGERFQLDAPLLQNLRSENSYWDKKTVDLMFREEQNYTDYTLVTLQEAFFIFLGILLLQGIFIGILKNKVSSHFELAGWRNKIGHVVESLHVPDVYKDFDVDLNPGWQRAPHDYRMSYRSVQNETFWMTCLQMVSNFFLLLPLFVTGDKRKKICSFLILFLSSLQSE